MYKQELINYTKGLNGNDNIVELIKNQYKHTHSLSEWEHIIDYLIHKNFTDLSWAGFDLLKEKARKWVEMLNRNVARIDEEEDVDFKTVLDFEDGFRFVQLLSQKAYVREGNLMSHCVASYYGRPVEIYSLRDSFNKPHCTMEKDMQIKGKGNGDISPKYIRYVVEFLEYTGMNVREREMKNVGYKKVSFAKYVKDKTKLFRGEYIRESEVVEYMDEVVIFNDIHEAVRYKGNKICLFDGYAYFRNSQITDLGQLQSIGGSAYFRNSQITDLGQLQSIGESADFRNSQITDLGQLQSICGSAYFGGSQITDLGQLQSIGGDADFGNSQITDLGQLQSIGGYAYFRGSKITDLGQLQSIGGDAYFRGSKITDWSNVKVGCKVVI